MSKKQSIKEQTKKLKDREEKIMKQLDEDSDNMKDRVVRVGTIAAISGIVVLASYGIYRLFFAENDKETEDKESRPKKNQAAKSRISSTLTTIALPYIDKLLSGLISDDKKEDSKKEDQKQS